MIEANLMGILCPNNNVPRKNKKNKMFPPAYNGRKKASSGNTWHPRHVTYPMMDKKIAGNMAINLCFIRE
jgi:hypothetical protein